MLLLFLFNHAYKHLSISDSKIARLGGQTVNPIRFTIVSFPYGIKNGQLPETDLRKAFSDRLIIHLGQSDTNPNSAGLRHNTVADDQQGLYRLGRGRYFFDVSQSAAANMQAFFNREKHELAGIGHDAQLMANDALQYLLNPESAVGDNSLPGMVVYPVPATRYITLGGT